MKKFGFFSRVTLDIAKPIFGAFADECHKSSNKRSKNIPTVKINTN